MTMRIDTRHIAVFGKARINHPQNHHPFVALLALFHIIPVLEQHAAFWQEYYWTLMFQLQAVFQQFSTVHCVDSLTADTDCDSGMCGNVQADLAGSPLNISQPSPHPAKQMDYSKTYGSHQISTSVLCTFSEAFHDSAICVDLRWHHLRLLDLFGCTGQSEAASFQANLAQPETRWFSVRWAMTVQGRSEGMQRFAQNGIVVLNNELLMGQVSLTKRKIRKSEKVYILLYWDGKPSYAQVPGMVKWIELKWYSKKHTSEYEPKLATPILR